MGPDTPKDSHPSQTGANSRVIKSAIIHCWGLILVSSECYYRETKVTRTFPTGQSRYISYLPATLSPDLYSGLPEQILDLITRHQA